MQISRSVEPASVEPERPGSTECPSDREDGVVATSQRQHILNTALALMAQRGVDGTSMRDLASAMFSITLGSAAGFDNGLAGSMVSASRLITRPVRFSKTRARRSRSVPLVMSMTERKRSCRRAAAISSSISVRRVGSPPVNTMESVSRRISFRRRSVSLVGNSSLKTSGSFCVQ